MPFATTHPMLLEVQDLVVNFALRGGDLTALNGISFSLDKGQRLGLVGESGAGKSVAGFSIINLISKPGYIAGGKVLFQGREISAMSFEQLRRIRGNVINMVFQDPMMTLNPVLTIGTQMRETIQAHQDISDKEATALAVDKLRQVHIPSPEKRLHQYPHEFSGGMRQRIIIAIALLNNPQLIIADEPTTALDVTIQAEIMDLFLELCSQQEMGLILITHDLAVVSETTEKMAVMYAGQVVEQGPTDAVIDDPQHPYTKGLIAALPQIEQRGTRLSQIPGTMPNLTSIPPGCSFHPRCPMAQDVCSQHTPDLLPTQARARLVACHRFQP
ncbi:MAG: ABC transporter ATP-binding protein [Desulfovermiculus sp.]